MTNALTSEKLVACVKHLPNLPAVATALLSSFQDENLDMDTLARKMARDPALAADTLRLANSSFYGLSGKVSSLGEAMMVLGLRQVRALVVTAAVVRILPTPGHYFDIKTFWRHSLAVALCARHLARHGREDPEQAYLAGLLHDIGRLALATCFKEAFQQAEDYRNRHDCQMFEAERDTLGLDHADAGEAITRHWRFPARIREAVARHHAPDGQEADSLAGIVHVADVLAHALDLSQQENDLVPQLSTVAWNRLGLDWPEIAMDLVVVEDNFRSMIPMLLPEAT